MMRRPKWTEDRDGYCQWPGCQTDGDMKYSAGSTRWVKDDPVWLCSPHAARMSDALSPDPEPPCAVGESLWLAAADGFEREQVWLRDWFIGPEGTMVLLVTESSDDPEDAGMEVGIGAIEICLSADPQ